MIDLYAVLGIGMDADAPTIAKAITSARQQGLLNPEVLDKAEAWLLDAPTKARYDAQLRQQHPDITATQRPVDMDNSRLSAPTVLAPKPASIQQSTPSLAKSSPATTAPAANEHEPQSYYEALVGNNADYYLSQFDAIAHGQKTGFNWGAFWGGSFWFCSRGMWGLGLGAMSAPIVVLILGGILAAIMGAAGVIVVVVWLLWRLIWLPLKANQYYHQFAQRRIKQLQFKFPQKPERQLKSLRGTTNWWAGIAILGVMFFVMLFVLGIVSAISLPLYQDYIIRSKMQQSYQQLLSMKAPVERQLQQSGMAQSHDAQAKAYVNDDALKSFGEHAVEFEADQDGVGRIWGTWSGNGVTGRMENAVMALERDNVGLWTCHVYEGDGTLAAKHLPKTCQLESQ